MGRPKRAAAAKAEEKVAAASPQPKAKKAKGGLAVGDQLPEFEVQTDEEQTLSSTDLVGGRDREGNSSRNRGVQGSLLDA